MSGVRVRVGVQLWPQHCTLDALRAAWREADAMGVDSLWVWDHFFPLTPPADGAHFECWSLLAAMAADTSHATIGSLVSSVSYRNPDLLADIARTADHVSGGRVVLGVGAGWSERDHVEYGFPMGAPRERQRRLADALPRIRARLDRLAPPPVPRTGAGGASTRLPILMGSGGERVGLRLVARHADVWNWFGDPGAWAAKSRVLDEWCDRLERPRGAIERSVLINDPGLAVRAEEYVEAGCTHVILGLAAPFDMAPVRALRDRLRS